MLDRSTGTNSTRQIDLTESMKGLQFLSVSENAAFLGSGTIGSERNAFETGAEVLEDLRGHVEHSYSLLDSDVI